jgi:hypothetical protein
MMSSGAHAFFQLEIEIGDQAFLGAFDDVIGKPLIERKVGCFHLRLLRASAEKFGDFGDVVLIDGRLLFAGLLAPVGGRGNLRRRGVEQ